MVNCSGKKHPCRHRCGVSSYSGSYCLFYYSRCRPYGWFIRLFYYCCCDFHCRGRPALISAATGAIALLVVPLVQDYGVEYLLAATILMGFLQVLLGILKIGRLMKFIPNSVMIGFVNALGIMIFMSQIEH